MKIYTHPNYSYVRVAEISKDEIKKIDIAHCQEPTETLSHFYDRQVEKPSIVTNAGFFNMSNGAAVFNLLDEKKTISSDVKYQWGMGITTNGDLKYGSLNGGNSWRDFISGYPNLIDGGKKVPITFATEINYKARRTMLGYNDKTIFIVCVENPGMYFAEMQNLMYNLGCTYAINLDGGGSTKMLYEGKSYTKDNTNRAVDNVLAVYLKPTSVKKMIIPFESGKARITSRYAMRTLSGKTAFHYGYDMVGVGSTNVVAAVSGTVVSSTMITNRSNLTWEWGNYVCIKGIDGYYYYYCHLAQRLVNVGQTIPAGHVIGIQGHTGAAQGDHLHFEVRKSDRTTQVCPQISIGVPNQINTFDNTMNFVANIVPEHIDITYNVYSGGRWWGNVKNYNLTNSDGYAGVENKHIRAIKAYISCGNLKYRVHTIEGKWLPWVSNGQQAGTGNVDIDAIQFDMPDDATHTVVYRVSRKDNTGYLPWVVGTTDWAGNLGTAIDKIQVYVK